MKPTQVRLFIKTYCGWCDEAIDWLEEHRIAFETLDVNTDPAAFKEMLALSHQTKAPVIEIDGKVLADFGADELAEWMEKEGFDTR